MNLPGWLDVVLEGGVLQLQRALAGYRTLRRLHAAGWQTRAVEVVDTCQFLQRSEASVTDALERARRRARLEVNAQAVLPLVEEVERERARLISELGGGESMVVLLSRFEETARDVSWFALAFRRFSFERRTLVGAGALSLGLVPLLSWGNASKWGVVPTLFDFSALAETDGVWALLVVMIAVVFLFWARLSTWGWLGVRSPRLIVPVVLGLFAMLISVALDVSARVGVIAMLLAALSSSFVMLAARRPDESALLEWPKAG